MSCRRAIMSRCSALGKRAQPTMKAGVAGSSVHGSVEPLVNDPSQPLDKSSVLRAVGDWVRREVDLGELLNRVIEAVTHAMDAERCTIYLVDRTRGEVFSKAASLPEIKEIRLKLGQGVAGLVAKSGQL